MKTAVVLARGQFRTTHAKTAHGLILHGRRYRIIAVIDETCAGRDAGEAMGIGKKGIPIVSDFKELDALRAPATNLPGTRHSPSGTRPPVPGTVEDRPRAGLLGREDRLGRSSAARHPAPGTLIIGVAPTGGRLPPAWRRDIRQAIRRGMDIVSGLHDFIGDDPALSRLAREKGVRIIDVRRPPERLALAQGQKWPVPVVLTCGTDCAVGKRTVTIELARAARKRGIDAAFVATGQTGVLVGADAGAVIDRIPGDFMSGAVESMIGKMVRRGKELVFVQGQASLSHHAYGPVTLGILYGARPHYAVLVHEPGRRVRPSFPDQPVADPLEEAALVKRLAGAEPVGLSLNCSRFGGDATAVCRDFGRRTGLPAVDVLRDGPDRLLDALLERLAKDGRFRFGPGLRRAIRAMAARKEGKQ